MDFIQHTIKWCNGEIFEATIIGLCGLLTIVIALVIWKFGETPGAKALLIPFLVIGVLFVAVGASSYINNQKRMPQLTQAYSDNPTAFVQSEKERVDGFQYLYTITMVVASICLALAIAFFWLSTSVSLRAIGIALLIIGMSGLVIDYFSKERADIYYEAITTEKPGDA